MSLVLLSPLAIGAFAYGLEATLRRRDRKRFPPPGRLVDAGGHRLHARLLGEGHKGPVVVLEADSGSWSTSWDRLPERLSENHPVVVYDRAGLGWSEPGPKPRDLMTRTQELHALLRELVPDRQVILVGHGAGARIAWDFGARYPFHTAGLVALDGEHDSLAVELGAEGVPSAQAGAGTLRLLDWAGRFGILRALGFTPPIPEGVPGATFEVLKTLTPHALAAIRAEDRDANAPTAPQGLEVPVEVLVSTATLGEEAAHGLPHDFPGEDYNRLWQGSSRRFAEICPQARLREFEGDHFAHIGRPRLVEEAVARVVAARD